MMAVHGGTAEPAATTYRLVEDAPWDQIRCHHGCDGSPVVGIYYFPRGCAVWSDKVQALCGQHVISAPGPMYSIVIRTDFSL